MKTLITARFDRAYLPRLEALGCSCSFSGFGVTGIKLSEEELIRQLDGVALLISEFEDVTERVIEASRALRMIACCRNEAFASIDIEAATKRGIPVLRAGGRNCIAVAEHAIALLMCVSKNISLTDYKLKYTDEMTTGDYYDKKGQRNNIISEWSMDPKAPFAQYGGGPEMYGKLFGQIGFGAIGYQVAKRATALGMRLQVFDPFVAEEKIAAAGGQKVDLDTLMRTSDFISVNCNVTPETRGLVGRAEISKMKPSSYIVNTARAPIVDYDALYDALAEKRIAGAGLDVYPKEPIPKGYKFLSLTNAVLTPHLAGSSRDIVTHQSEIVVTDIERIQKGQPPRFLTNPGVLDNGAPVFAMNE